MTDDGWTSTVAFDDLVDGKGVRVTVNDVDVLLVRSGEQLHGIGGRCTHQGARSTGGHSGSPDPIPR
jgi:nitrite reductase/ring-hydroxylating ferredoxin subunit